MCVLWWPFHLKTYFAHAKINKNQVFHSSKSIASISLKNIKLFSMFRTWIDSETHNMTIFSAICGTKNCSPCTYVSECSNELFIFYIQYILNFISRSCTCIAICLVFFRVQVQIQNKYVPYIVISEGLLNSLFLVLKIDNINTIKIINWHMIVQPQLTHIHKWLHIQTDKWI